MVHPSENVVKNVQTFMKKRTLNQEQLALRMRSMGFSWHRRTVNRIIRSERRIDVDELYGMALALETSVGALLWPDIDTKIVDFAVEYKIGDLEPVTFNEFSKLLNVAENLDAVPALGVTGWPEHEEDSRTPTWRPKSNPLAAFVSRIESALSLGGWENIGQFRDAHPDLDSVRALDVVSYIERHPKGHETRRGRGTRGG